MFDIADRGQSIAGSVDATIGGAALIVDKVKAEYALSAAKMMTREMARDREERGLLTDDDRRFIGRMLESDNMLARGRMLGLLQAARGAWLDVDTQTAEDYANDTTLKGPAAGGERAVKHYKGAA